MDPLGLPAPKCSCLKIDFEGVKRFFILFIYFLFICFIDHSVIIFLQTIMGEITVKTKRKN